MQRLRRAIAACAMVSLVPLCAAQSAEPRPWNLSLRAFAIHDSNVPLAATDTVFSGKTSSNVYGLALSGEYRLYRDAQWTASATGTAQQTYNAESRLREFDLTSVAPGVVARRALRFGGRPGALTLSYSARRDWLGGSAYANGHTASVDLGVRPRFSTDLGAFAGFGRNNFDDDGPDPQFSSRDATSYRAGVRAMQAFNHNRQALQATLAYVKNDAEGANFVFDGPAASVQLLSFLVGPWAMSASASYAAADYTSFTTVPRRENRNVEYRLAVFGPLSRKLSADVSVARSEQRSNQAAFEARRDSVAIGLGYNF